jgi:hypothetical protein
MEIWNIAFMLSFAALNIKNIEANLTKFAPYEK